MWRLVNKTTRARYDALYKCTVTVLYCAIEYKLESYVVWVTIHRLESLITGIRLGVKNHCKRVSFKSTFNIIQRISRINRWFAPQRYYVHKTWTIYLVVDVYLRALQSMLKRSTSFLLIKLPGFEPLPAMHHHRRLVVFDLARLSVASHC